MAACPSAADTAWDKPAQASASAAEISARSGWSELLDNNITGAGADFDAALASDPDCVLALEGMSLVATMMDDATKRTDYLLRILEITNDTNAAVNALAELRTVIPDDEAKDTRSRLVSLLDRGGLSDLAKDQAAILIRDFWPLDQSPDTEIKTSGYPRSKPLEPFLVCGPFKYFGFPDMDKTFDPELAIKTEYIHNTRKIKWFPVASDRFTYGWLPVFAGIPVNDSSTAYALTYIKPLSPGKVTFILRSDNPFALWVDGKLLAENLGFEIDEPYFRTATALLDENWHRILVKAIGSGNSDGIKIFTRSDVELEVRADISLDASVAGGDLKILPAAMGPEVFYAMGSNPVMLFVRGRSLGRQGITGSALEVLERLRQLAPDWFGTALLEAELRVNMDLETGGWQAVPVWQGLSRLLDQGVDTPWIRRMIGDYLYATQRYDAAQEMFDAAGAGLDPEPWPLKWRRSRTAQARNLGIVALDPLSGLQAASWRNPRALSWAALLYMLNNRYSQGLELSEASIHAQPFSLRIVLDSLDNLVFLGRLDEAGRVVETLGSLDPENRDLMEFKIKLDLARNNPVEAVETAGRMTELWPLDPQTHQQLAKALLAADRFDLARNELETSKEFDPSPGLDQQAFDYLRADQSDPLADWTEKLLTGCGVENADDPTLPPGSEPGVDARYLQLTSMNLIDGAGNSREENVTTIQVLTENGMSGFGDQWIPGHGLPLMARVKLPDGTTAFANSVKNDNKGYIYSLPLSRKGAVVELKYATFGANRTFKGFGFTVGLFSLIRFSQKVDYIEKLFVMPKTQEVRWLALNGERIPVPEEVPGHPELKLYRFKRCGEPVWIPEKGMPGIWNSAPLVLASQWEPGDVVEFWTPFLQRYSAPTPVIIRAAQKLTAGLETEKEKIAALYEFVQKEIEPSDSGLNAAEETFTVKKGSAASKAVLMMAFLRSLGIQSAYSAGYQRADRPANDVCELNIFFSNPMIRVLDSRGNAVWMDFSDRYLTFDTISYYMSGQKVLRFDNALWEPLPDLDPGANAMSYKFKCGLLGTGTLECIGSVAGLGAWGTIRSYMADPSTRSRFVSELMQTVFPGATVSDFNVMNVDDRRQTPGFEAAFNIDGILADDDAGQRSMLLSGLKLDLTGRYITGETRRFPIEIARPSSMNMEVEVDLDPALKPKSFPDDIHIDNKFGVYVRRWSSTPTGIKLEKKGFLRAGIIQLEDYPAFVQFTRAIDNSDTESVKFSGSN